ncbi:MAG: hypothetical protein NW226_01785, partial [Microscillaceae bacterium]|nr:hypothetical protein [Microscillaceae bacterium]
MKNLFLTILLFATCTCIQTLSAQVTYHPKNPPTSEEKILDSQVLTCVGETELFGKSFSFAEWTATLHYYTGKMLQRLSAEHVSKIAIEKKRVEALFALVQNCEALKSIAPEMEDIHKIYQEEI